MPELPPKKVGIIACSGEEMAAGTVTRLAALKVLEELRPDDTVTICLPLFVAGGEGDRAQQNGFAPGLSRLCVPARLLHTRNRSVRTRLSRQYLRFEPLGILVPEIADEAVAGLDRFAKASEPAQTESPGVVEFGRAGMAV